MLSRRHHTPSLSSSSASSSSSPYADDVSDYSASSDEVESPYQLRERLRREQMQQEWDEGLEQLQLIFVVVLMPWLGKFWGRKWAHSLHARYLKVGISKAFFYL